MNFLNAKFTASGQTEVHVFPVAKSRSAGNERIPKNRRQ
jgi:hypothetical protein